MDNSAKILNAMVAQGIIIPCIRINRAIDIASRDNGAQFKLEMSFTITSGGKQLAPVTSNQLVRDTTYIELLDSRWVRARGREVNIPAQPDRGSFIVASVIVTITDARGNRVEHCDTEVTIVPVP
jgi:hypothetical protein